MRNTFLSVLFLFGLLAGCQPTWEYCAPIDDNHFQPEYVTHGHAYTRDGFEIRVTLILDSAMTESQSFISADDAAERIASTLDWYRYTFPTHVPRRDWTIYVASGDSAIWPSHEDYESMYGCSFPTGQLFPTVVEGEEQIVVSDHDFLDSSRDGLVTICHETLHLEAYLATGNSDGMHQNPVLWAHCN